MNHHELAHLDQTHRIKCSDPSRIPASSAAYQITCSAKALMKPGSEYRNELQRDSNRDQGLRCVPGRRNGG